MRQKHPPFWPKTWFPIPVLWSPPGAPRGSPVGKLGILSDSGAIRSQKTRHQKINKILQERGIGRVLY